VISCWSKNTKKKYIPIIFLFYKAYNRTNIQIMFLFSIYVLVLCMKYEIFCHFFFCSMHCSHIYMCIFINIFFNNIIRYSKTKKYWLQFFPINSYSTSPTSYTMYNVYTRRYGYFFYTKLVHSIVAPFLQHSRRAFMF
jgi:hypothetical protein